MSTQQKVIRDAIVARLTTQLTGLVAPEHIFRSPERDLADSEIPAVCVFSHSDRPANSDDNTDSQHRRIYTVRIEVVSNGRPQEDATDDLAIAVRRALLSDDSLPSASWVPAAWAISWSGQIWSGSEGEQVQALTALDFDVFYLWRPE
jgi:hypothetical protein